MVGFIKELMIKLSERGMNMKKSLMAIILFALICMPSLISEENKETDYTYWRKQNVEHNGVIINLYYAKTTQQFLNNLFPTMKEELSIKNYNAFDSKIMNNNFISAEGIKKNYPKTYKHLFQAALKQVDTDNSAFSHKDGFEYIWYGVPLGDNDYMVFALWNLADKEFLSVYSGGLYTFKLLASFEQSLK